MNFKDYLRDRKTRVDAFIEGWFDSGVLPDTLRESMVYSLSAGGKRVRPILSMAAYEACGGDPADIVPYASAIEFIHTYSLIHDDLPAMDDDDLRRGLPTNHKVFGEAVAILAGDGLLTEAFYILSDPNLGRNVRTESLLSALREISSAAGCRGMVAGQVQDMLSENSEPDEETLAFIHRHKTAALLRASVRSGALLYGCGSAELQSLTSYGDNIGMAFQVVDDILDVEGDTKEMGKTAGSDERVNKMTYPRIYGLERSKEIASKMISDAISALDMFGSDAEPLRAIARYLLDRRS